MIEITSFVLGMLTVGAALMLITLVAGIVKINKLEKQNNHNEKQFEQVYNDICRNDNDIKQSLDGTNRDINMVEKTIMNHIHQIDEMHHKIEKNIHLDIEETRRYIDSRIDKVVASGVLKEPKRQIING